MYKNFDSLSLLYLNRKQKEEKTKQMFNEVNGNFYSTSPC